MYFYFGTDNFLILGLFLLFSGIMTLIGLVVFGLSVKILLALKNIREYIKKRGER